MAAANQILIPLAPIDAEKGYPQWGRIVPATPTTPERIEWTLVRQTDSTRFRETYSGFEQDAVYEIAFMYPGFPEPFTSTATGRQLAPNDASGFPTERQANYPYGMIGQLPTYAKVVNGTS
jgi:hypothetical protein